MLIAPPEGYNWPPGTSRAWRVPLGDVVAPGAGVASGTELLPSLKVFHDGDGSYVTATKDAAGVTISVGERSGTFLSLALAVRGEQAEAFAPRHIVTLAGRAALQGRRRLFGRLNLRQGPNTSQQPREAELNDGLLLVEFDPFYMDIPPIPIDSFWVDLIVEEPASGVLTLTDMTLSLRPRAEV